MRTYRAVLSVPGVASAMATSVLARLPIGALGLVLILRVRALGGSYAAAGVVAGAFMLGNGTSAPLLGRLIDRVGQTRVLVVGSAIASAAIGGLATLGHGVPLAVPIGLSALAGIAMPPLGGCVRVLLAELVSDPTERHAAFALEASTLEIVFLIGPLVIVGLIAAASPVLALAVCAGLLFAGTLAFAAAPASRHWRPTRDDSPRSLAGPLRHAGVRTLVAALGLLAMSFGAVEVSTAAFAQHHGAPHAVGPLLALWGFASLVGGVVVGRFAPSAEPSRRMAFLLAALAAGDALLLLAPSPALLAVGLVAAGLPIAPFFAQIYGLVTAIAPAGTVTESSTWLATGIGGGFSAGSALGGVLIGGAGSHAGYALAVAGALAALVTVRGSVALLRPQAAPVPA